MRKTYITSVPDKAGMFLQASTIIAEAGALITRVSYNKAVDMHMMFIETEADADTQKEIEEKLREIGYIADSKTVSSVLLIEFRLQKKPGAVLPMLRLISSYHFNITYINAPESDDAFQSFKMGIFIENPASVKSFLDEAAHLCDFRIIDYDKSRTILDNTVFYLSFAGQVADTMHLTDEQRNSLITDSNLIMQMLDERKEAPYKTFSFIGKIAEFIERYHGENFAPCISQRRLKSGLFLYQIEPPCGSNTHILTDGHKLLFIDCGFACYEKEMHALLSILFPNFDTMEKSLLLTHPDIDHCGLMHCFDRVYTSDRGIENFRLETEGQPNIREQNPKHAPYCRISKLMSGYRPPDLSTLISLGNDRELPVDPPLRKIGAHTFCGVTLDIYAGNGGHTPGELAIIDETDHLVFSGDIVVNIKGFSPEQAAFNKLAPYLMTSVNMDSVLATKERLYLGELFPEKDYIYLCGHGASMETIPVQLPLSL